VKDWEWGTVPLAAFTAIALFYIEGSLSKVEIPFQRSRPNHLALDGYCLVILDSVQGLVVHNTNIKSQQDCNIYDGGGYEEYHEDEDDTEEEGTIEA
jgi:predicted membrane chloride channel (bestrophin family)